MNEHDVRTTKEEKRNFPYVEYPSKISLTGTHTVTLVDKCWGKHTDILCAFITDKGMKFSANIRRRSKDSLYAPGESRLDFSKVPVGSKMKCSIASTSQGYVKLTDAVPIA